MAPAVTKVVYKPDSQSTDEYTVVINPEEYHKWKGGDKTIPLASVVDSFSVFHSSQGAQGLLGKPSNQQLETVFGTSKDVDVVTKILEGGREQKVNGLNQPPTTLNPANSGSEIRR
ncbi:ribosome maturation protein [Ephemerocybe angulata]|uniref:Ribosome maturation protein n=1 Tax=Ephemerocybe angulata TaxID=980116 RepID=A0A8H6MFH6_9AGAR|nr:ribosome maturation protein [Tulosesus angulatus]